jgi:hypothetical protein
MVHSVRKVANCIQLQVMYDVMIFGELPYSSITSPILQPITDRFALPTLTVCMKPNFQGLLWDEFCGLGEDEPKKLFLLSK